MIVVVNQVPIRSATASSKFISRSLGRRSRNQEKGSLQPLLLVSLLTVFEM